LNHKGIHLSSKNLKYLVKLAWGALKIEEGWVDKFDLGP